MIFVFQYYPQYAMNPTKILDWLLEEATRIFYEQEEIK